MFPKTECYEEDALFDKICRIILHFIEMYVIINITENKIMRQRARSKGLPARL